MRDIKFRGLRKDNNGWACGDLLQMPYPKIVCEGISELATARLYGHTVLPETIGQFTGLCDRNGKEIYEDDILRDEQGIGEVKWMPEHCAFMVRTIEPHQYHRLESDGQLWGTEVIGNIYDHPHLLEAKSDG